MAFISMTGMLAAALTTAAYLPQVYKTIRTRSAKDLSITTFSMLFAGTLMGFIYSSYIHDTPFMLTNGITAVLSGIIFCLKIVSMKNEK
jgi:MtN3 and saliva related transmembrane protein